MSLINLEQTQMTVNVTKCRYGCIFLIVAENAFNFINRKVMLHNLKFICPIIATYIVNFYATPSRLFIVGWGDIFSSEAVMVQTKVTQNL